MSDNGDENLSPELRADAEDSNKKAAAALREITQILEQDAFQPFALALVFKAQGKKHGYAISVGSQAQKDALIADLEEMKFNLLMDNFGKRYIAEALREMFAGVIEFSQDEAGVFHA